MKKLTALLFFVAATGSANAQTNAMQRSNCYILHEQLFLMALGGAPEEPMNAFIRDLGAVIRRDSFEAVSNQMLQTIYTELGRAVYVGEKPNMLASRNEACKQSNLDAYWK